MSTLYRKRLIPEECILLKDDNIIYQDENYIITTWKTFRPKSDFSNGISCYCIKEGYKISKFFREDGTLTYIYCDIINTTYDSNSDTYTFTDLLADVIIENNGLVRVVDLDEIGDAMKDGLLTVDSLDMAMKQLNSLLNEIYSGSFSKYTEMLDKYLEK